MVGPSKILTVSYGTFSCTLEGFDDPFSTMRGIAEYFRDLAADDRYFGAEPPTPDAEMLHRIAEKEIQRKVESQVSPTGIVLRQAEEAPVEAPVAEAPAQIADVAEPSQPVAPSTPAPATADLSGASSVAERLARIRGVVAQNESDFAEEDVANAPFDQGAEDEEEAVADAVMQANDEPLLDGEEGTDDAVAEPEIEEVEAQDEATIEEVAEAEIDEHAEPAADSDEDADSEMLSNIMAVQDDAEDSAEEDIVEDVAVDDGINESVELAAEELAEQFEAEEPSDQFESDESAELDVDALADVLNSSAEEEHEQETFADGHDEESEDDAFDLGGFDIAADDEEKEVAEAEDTALELVSDGDDAAQPQAELHEEPSSFAELIAAEKEMAENDVTADEAAEDDEEEDGTVSRLLRMRLSDAAAQAESVGNNVQDTVVEPLELAAEDAVATDEDQTEEPHSMALDASNSSLSDEDEQDLQAELARLSDEDEAEVDEVEADAAEAEEARPMRPITRPEGVRVERLLEVTNNEMADGEGSRRRSAIAHLKAAVAATRADREAKAEDAQIDDAGEDVDDISSYREDLARVVRPRRLADGARNVARRLAPLVLVSEQRIENDVTEEAPGNEETGFVRPRRISGQEVHEDADEDGENIFSEAGSFAEFARDVGATELPDLLEAAAAYYHFVEGQPHFSRPQVMNAVAAVDDQGGFSREEGLRSFGMLLRRGKFRKIRRGQFEIAESTRFRPELQAGE